MFGVDDMAKAIGILPSAIAWLYRLIEHRKERSGSRFSVRVSAGQLNDRTETLKDLLAHLDCGTESQASRALYIDVCLASITTLTYMNDDYSGHNNSNAIRGYLGIFRSRSYYSSHCYSTYY